MIAVRRTDPSAAVSKLYFLPDIVYETTLQIAGKTTWPPFGYKHSILNTTTVRTTVDFVVAS